MEYPNHRKCCGTCANWKEPNRTTNAERTSAITQATEASCQSKTGLSQLFKGGCGGCDKYRKWNNLR